MRGVDGVGWAQSGNIYSRAMLLFNVTGHFNKIQ
jgi:hypothetical protein